MSGIKSLPGTSGGGISLPGVKVGLSGTTVGLRGAAAASIQSSGGSWLTPSAGRSTSLSQVALQAGNVSPPLKADPAKGNTNTQPAQRSIVMGEVIPIVFTRRLGKDGGVMLQPGCTEAAFSVNGSNTLTAKYHLVLGEGQMFEVQRRDVSQIGLRRGTFSQTYGKRAGNWTPGNTIAIPTSGTYRVASYNCGGGSSGYGTYAGLTTFSFITVCPDGDDSWKGQISIFIRGGLKVTRLVDGQFGPSSNVVDLAKYLLTQSARVPSAVLDSSSLTSAATFIDANLFRWDGVIKDSTNLRDWLAQTLPYYLLRESSVNGKLGLRPLLPVNNDGTINTGTITPAFLFDETSIIAGSLEIQYIPLAERKPVCLQMQWRQQDECQWPLVRTSEVRYRGTAETGPYEQHDLSYCATNENHVIKAGTYILARRRYVTHTARITLRPGAASRSVVAGDIIQLRLTRESSTGSIGSHNRLYTVERIVKDAAGALTLELLHFPIDSSGRSLIALDVAAAAGTGLLLNPNTEGAPDDYSCDDNTVPPDDSLPASSWPPIDNSFFSGGSLSGGLEAPGTDTGTPPSDPLGDRPGLIVNSGTDGSGNPVTTLQIPGLNECPNPSSQWLKGQYIKPDGTIMYAAIAGEIGSSLTITGALYGAGYTAVFTCDGSNPITSTNAKGIVTLASSATVFPSVQTTVPNGYKILLRYFRTDTQTVEPTIVANSYGAYGVDGPSSGGVFSLWVTNSSGAKEVTGDYFGTSFGNNPADGPFLIYISAGTVAI
jgi:hypothetical protein